jgi:hypothetical protein
VLEPTEIIVELVTRNESGSDPAGDRPQFVVTDQRANVVLGAAELRGNLANCQRGGPLHAREVSLVAATFSSEPPACGGQASPDSSSGRADAAAPDARTRSACLTLSLFFTDIEAGRR